MASDQGTLVPKQPSYDADMHTLANRVSTAYSEAARRTGNLAIGCVPAIFQDLLERGIIEVGPGLAT